MTVWFWLFKGLEESVLSGFVHGVGGGDDKKALGSFFAARETEKVANLLNGDDGGGLRPVGAKIERMREIYCGVGRYDKNTTAGLRCDTGEVGKLVEKHGLSDHRGELGRDWRFEGTAYIARLARDGDLEGFSVKHQAWRGLPVAVDDVAEDRRTKVLEMDTKLMRATGDRLELEEAFAVVAFKDTVFGLRGLAVLINLESGGPLEITADGEVDECFGELRSAVDDGEVSLVSLAILELLAEHLLSRLVFS